MIFIKTLGLFVVTALTEIVVCYLPYLWLKKQGSVWLLIYPRCIESRCVCVAAIAAHHCRRPLGAAVWSPKLTPLFWDSPDIFYYRISHIPPT